MFQRLVCSRKLVRGATPMGKPVTLFTGQWADLKLEDLRKKARDFGYDGLELACWGDHFEVGKAISEDGYCERKRELLEKHDLQCFAISNHLVGQGVLDNIDARHKGILPPHVWGGREPARREPSCHRRNEEHSPRRPEDGRRHRQRLHWLQRLAFDL
jgi:hypothetical protein